MSLFFFLRFSLRSVVLTQPRLFQDSSLALETFHGVWLSTKTENPQKAKKRRSFLRSVEISKSVLDLADFEFEPILDRIGDSADLESVILQGTYVDKSNVARLRRGA